MWFENHFKRDETLVHQESQARKEAAVLLRRSLSAVLMTAAVLSFQGSALAGWFSKKNECCEECPPPKEKEKKHCCHFMPPAPPRAATAIAVPAVVTAHRADRLPAKAPVPPAAAPAAPGACTDAAPMRDARVDQLHNEVQIIKEQLRVLTTLLQENQ